MDNLGKEVGTTETDDAGAFAFRVLKEKRYRLQSGDPKYTFTSGDQVTIFAQKP